MNQFRNLSFNLLRIVSGFLLLQHGLQKTFALLGSDGVALMSRSGFAGMLEFVGGIALIIGLGTQPVAFVLSGLMAFAYFLAHAPRGFWPIQNGGELAALFSFVFLFLAGNGGGDFSIDGWLRRRAESSKAKTG